MPMYHLLRSLLLLMLLAPAASQAVTLGEARVNSFLNQPLDAEIDLIGLTPGQHESLRLRIANREHFERLGIVYDHFLSQLSFDVVQSSGQWLVRARSERPVAEPFLDFPLQMTWPGGQLIKQYTLLLDPPRPVRPASAASTASRTAARTSPAAPPATRSAGKAQVATESYGPVRSGETLWPIAQRLKPRGITTQQMAMALLRANPQAFIDNNVNKLRAGATLAVPSRAFIEELDAAAAQKEFAAQSRRWQAPVATSPRAVESAVVVPSAPAVEPPAKPAASQPPAKPAQPPVAAKAPESEAQLRILAEKDKEKTEPGSEQDLEEKLLVTMEEIESNRITTDAIETRLARLEAELQRMQRLVELKDAQIEALQSEVTSRDGAPSATGAPAPADAGAAAPAGGAITPPSPTTTPVVAPIEPIVADTGPVGERPWYEQQLWLVWAVLGLLGLTALVMFARRGPVEPEPVIADLPPVNRETHMAYRAETTPAAAEMKQAARDLRVAAREAPPLIDEVVQPAELPEVEIPRAQSKARGEETVGGGLTNSLLDTMIDESKLLNDHPELADHDDISDEDIASWVAELGAEAERAELRSANDERVPLDDDIPSILTELDDQLTSAEPVEAPRTAGINLEPVDEVTEDDAFSMSLDLARAYLEIGDQEGARDMLQQALAGARNPDHRRQIEELLQQIG